MVVFLFLCGFLLLKSSLVLGVMVLIVSSSQE